MRRTIILPALAGFLVLAPAAAFAWGAIAVDDEKGVSGSGVGYGYVTGEDNEKAAERGALKECRARNKSCKESTRNMPARAMAASNTSSAPVSLPVWEAAARRPWAERPDLTTMTGLLRAAARAADMNLRGLSMLSM